jgi:hypothetical protein
MLQRYYFKHMISYMSLLQNRTPSEASTAQILVTAPTSRMQLAAGATHDEWARWWWCGVVWLTTIVSRRASSWGNLL